MKQYADVRKHVSSQGMYVLSSLSCSFIIAALSLLGVVMIT